MGRNLLSGAGDQSIREKDRVQQEQGFSRERLERALCSPEKFGAVHTKYVIKTKGIRNVTEDGAVSRQVVS